MNRLAGGLIGIAMFATAAAADPYGGGTATPRRDGFAIGFALGSAALGGTGDLDEIRGVGGSAQLRLGTTASDSLLWLLEFEAGGYLVDIEDETGVDQTYNLLTTLTLGGQLYVREALWLRGGVGAASFRERQGRNGPVNDDSRRAGLAGTGGVGYDLFRRGPWVIDFGGQGSVAAFKGGVIARAAFHLGLSWY